MNNQNSGVLVIDADKEKIEKLKKRWSTVNKVSNVALTLSSSGFIVSLLSPFDFEGPVIEIVTAVLAGVGLVMKKVSEVKLNKLEGQAGEMVDNDDKKTLINITENIGHAISSRRKK